ncbi:hypothetical protein WICPIJ_005419 [Wickerhamomyces pijperi]|uniref:Sodium/calcium exchanger membrane region domain-containing protein n=1 Tax=Wickerhamomyces pijperi TaxID=599730 RepID=A0A9P8Q3L4_WICPI|nr:hypothetical protein WICPIJ_005419 [Wickerhamomyces pijperi]
MDQSHLQLRRLFLFVLGLTILLVIFKAGIYDQISAIMIQKIQISSEFCDISNSSSNSNEDICQYINEHCDLVKYQISEDYYCGKYPNAWFIASYGLLILVIFFCFGIISSNHLYPNLETISVMLNIPSKLTGLVLLAIGNAIPDISTLYHSISGNSTSLAIGEVLGSCNFILGVIIGCMCVLKKFTISKEEFLKDFVGFASLVVISLSFLYDSSLNIWECAVMVGLYLVYIWYAVVRSREGNSQDVLEQLEAGGSQSIARIEVPDVVIDEESGLLDDSSSSSSSVQSDLGSFYKYTARTPGVLSTLETVDLLSLDSGDYASVCGMCASQDSLLNSDDKPLFSLLFRYMNYKECLIGEGPSVWKVPLVFICNLIIPTYPKYLYEDLIDLGSLKKLKLYLFSFQVGVLSLYAIQNSNFHDLWIVLKLSLWLSIWATLVLMIFLVSLLYEGKVLGYLITFTGFITAVVCIDSLSFHLITILQNMALIFGVSESLLGLSILAICNSFSDLITNLTLTQLNLTTVAINTCFGSILIYFGVGIGLNSLLVMLKQSQREIQLDLKDPSFLISSVGVLCLLAVYVVAIPLNSWCLDWKIGTVAICLWLVVFIADLYV